MLYNLHVMIDYFRDVLCQATAGIRGPRNTEQNNQRRRPWRLIVLIDHDCTSMSLRLRDKRWYKTRLNHTYCMLGGCQASSLFEFRAIRVIWAQTTYLVVYLQATTVQADAGSRFEMQVGCLWG